MYELLEEHQKRESNELDWIVYVLSTQEMCLIGQGLQKEHKEYNKYYKQPYKLGRIIQGKLTVEEARKKRATRTHSLAFAKYFGLEVHPNSENPKGRYFVNISLEPIDKNGNTIRDPKPLDKSLKLISNYQKSKDFPFKRD